MNFNILSNDILDFTVMPNSFQPIQAEMKKHSERGDGAWSGSEQKMAGAKTNRFGRVIQQPKNNKRNKENNKENKENFLCVVPLVNVAGKLSRGALKRTLKLIIFFSF
jgi:hypothetical protein